MTGKPDPTSDAGKQAAIDAVKDITTRSGKANGKARSESRHQMNYSDFDELPPSEIWAAVVDAINRVTPNRVFKRGTALVSVVEMKPAIPLYKNEATNKYDDEQKVLAITTLTMPHIINAIREAVVCCKWSTNSDGELEERYVKFPETQAKTFAAYDKLDFPELRGLLHHLSIDRAGKWIHEDGYHKGSQLYVKIEHEPPKHLPKTCTKEDAKAALKRLREGPLKEFPFQTPEDKDAAIAMIMTVLLKPVFLFDENPGFLINARAQSSGKTELMNSAARLATGRPCAVRPFSTRKEQAELEIYTAARMALPIVGFDNLRQGHILKEEHYCKIITSASITGRVYYTQTEEELPNTLVPIFTGNLIETGGDMTSRIVVIDLKQTHEDMTQRKFEQDLRNMLNVNRAGYIQDVLTICKAYIDAGLPEGETGKVSRFHDWDKYVSRAIKFAGGSDVSAHIAKNADRDETRHCEMAVLEEIRDVMSGDWFALSELVTLYKDGEEIPERDVNGDKVKDDEGNTKKRWQYTNVSLRQAIDTLLYDSKNPARRFTVTGASHAFKQLCDRPMGGLMMTRDSTNPRRVKFRVVELSGQEDGEVVDTNTVVDYDDDNIPF